MSISTLLKAAAPLVGAAALCLGASAERLVILHTNDTHSSIDPASNGTGGILQRKAIIDSVRKAEKNVITVDAGDMVQGSLYFKYFRGDVEYPLMDMTGYDIRILGNHEFDNGMKDLAEKYRDVKGARLSSNYDFSGTELEGIFSPYVIKKVGGKKIGFIGLNVDPESLISKNNIDVRFKEIIPEANRLAAFLKNEKKCDLVVAVTHIGYEKENDKTTDPELIAASRDIDIVIGGHSHTLIDPNHPEKYPSLLPNADGKPVRVVQTGKYGRYVG
ncbi:MAG: metallophosphoesterase, partial [Muribaculaceae bacterium]|nr:metallophosphoesterase [Muribaculaceae bacterium]